MSPELIEKFAAPVPRYTSYPTAPHFNTAVTSDVYRQWLGALPQASRLSLYLHVPFCDRLCWFCGCHTKQTHRYGPVSRYLQSLEREILAVAHALGGLRPVSAIHLGGGSPTLLTGPDLLGLRHTLEHHFDIARDAEISVEIDPNDIDETKLDALAAFGLTRASLGVQDFDEAVQAAINRPQTFADTKRVVDGLRQRGVVSVNLDVLYGLPLQTTGKLLRTIEQVVSLAPDRIALFGYAHVPWVKKHQRLIAQETLPDTATRFEQASLAAKALETAGYVRIGLDHFARADDKMALAGASGELRRNFQGYTVDPAEALIGLGASAIGKLPQGYVQNTLATGVYQDEVDGGGLAVAKGFALSAEDRVRAAVIEQLMCQLSISYPELAAAFGADADPVIRQAHEIAGRDWADLVQDNDEMFSITEPGRPFVRTIAAAFDTYLAKGVAKHSAAV